MRLFGSKSYNKAFEERVMEIMAALYRTAVNLTRNSHDAEDLLQDAVFRAYRSFSNEGEIKNFKAWMMTILRNTYINRYRKKKKEPVEVEFTEGQTENFTNLDLSDMDEVKEEEFSEIVKNAIDNLPEKLRTTVILFYVDSFGYREIAEITGVPVGTVMSRLYNARQILKKKLSHEFVGKV